MKKPKTENGVSKPTGKAPGNARPWIRTWQDRVEDSDIDGFDPNDGGDTTDYDSDNNGLSRPKVGGSVAKKPAPKKAPPEGEPAAPADDEESGCGCGEE